MRGKKAKIVMAAGRYHVWSLGMKDYELPPENFVPGTLGCHEALHMASFLADAVDRELAEHPAIKQNHEWLSKARQAVELLGDLYRSIGYVHLDPVPDPPDPATPNRKSVEDNLISIEPTHDPIRGKHCLTYCGDDLCDCELAPRFAGRRI